MSGLIIGCRIAQPRTCHTGHCSLPAHCPSNKADHINALWLNVQQLLSLSLSLSLRRSSQRQITSQLSSSHSHYPSLHSLSTLLSHSLTLSLSHMLSRVSFQIGLVAVLACILLCHSMLVSAQPLNSSSSAVACPLICQVRSVCPSPPPSDPCWCCSESNGAAHTAPLLLSFVGLLFASVVVW